MVYWQVNTFDFVNFDDDMYVTENRHVLAGLTFDSIQWAFINIDHMCWQPLAWLSHMLDIQIYGMNPGGHHLTNLFLHIVNSLLLFLLFRHMTGALWRSAFVAALFALHPLNVDTVAWISERKNVLSMLFFILTIFAYFSYTKKPGLLRYLLSLSFFVMGLMSKPILVTVPFVLLLLDYWPIARLRNPKSITELKNELLKIKVQYFPANHTSSFTPRADHKQTPRPVQTKTILYLILEKIPFFIITAAYLYLLSYSLQIMGGVISTEIVPIKARIANALVSYVSYIGKMICPQNLSVYYPYPESVPMWQPVVATLLLTIISLLVIRTSRKLPFLCTGWLWFLGTLFPVIGIKQVGLWPAMADRWAYIPIIGLFITVSWGGAFIIERWRYAKTWLIIMASGMLMIFTFVSWMQVHYWKNSVTLFDHSINITDNNFIAYDNLGLALVNNGNSDEAFVCFSRSLKIKPGFAKSHHNIGAYYFVKGENDKAIAHLKEALKINPNSERAHNCLGLTMLRKGQIENAISHFQKALSIKPDYEKAQINLENSLALQR